MRQLDLVKTLQKWSLMIDLSNNKKVFRMSFSPLTQIIALEVVDVNV